MPELGRLARVPLREFWAHEASDFTPWLAQEGNIALLGEITGLDLEVEAQEQSVGPFRADILCKDALSDNWVLIENQLERTNHTHLGQLITYAAGLEAATVVWIAQQFTEEHRAALNWLNQVTGEELRFFGLELELWRIGDSAPAPKFNTIVQPNSWSKAVTLQKQEIRTSSLAPLKQMQLEYWTALAAKVRDKVPGVHLRTPGGKHYQRYISGLKPCNLYSWMNLKHKLQGLSLDLSGPNRFREYAFLLARETQISEQLGVQLIYEDGSKRPSCLIYTQTPFDLLRREQWEESLAWQVNMLQRFVACFRPMVPQLAALSPSSHEGDVTV